MNESLFSLFCSLLLWELVVWLLPSTYFSSRISLSLSLYLPTLILQLNLNEIPREESDNTWKGISRFSAGFPLILPYVYINGHTMAATLQKMYWFKLHTSIYFSTKLAENRQIHVCIHIADGRMVFDIYPYCVYYVCNCRTFLYVVPKLLFY